MTNSQKIKVHLLDQNGNAYTNLDECMRPYLKSLTPEQFDEDKNWWCTALEITGNQQSTFTIGQIVGNVISQVWDQIPALSRIKEWHKQAVDPSAACMEEANQVAKYFMMIHPRQTFQYIDNNGGKKGKSARYKMVGAVTEITLGSDVDWNKQECIAWGFGKTNYRDSSGDYKALLRRAISFFSNIDNSCLINYIINQNDKEWKNPECFASYDLLNHRVNPDYEHYKNVKLLCVNNEILDEEMEYFDFEHPIILQRADEQRHKPEVSMYLNFDITNNDIIQIVREIFDIYGFSYDDLKIQFI